MSSGGLGRLVPGSSELQGGLTLDPRFPEGAYGWSSGWRTDRVLDVRWSPDLAPRRHVILARTGRSVFFPLEDGEFRTPQPPHDFARFPFVRKRSYTAANRDVGTVALSSGAGSALFWQDGKVFKIKRCGFADRGFADPGYPSTVTVEVRSGHVESLEAVPAGLMSLTGAFAECRMTEELRREGLCTAYTPLGVAVITELPEAHTTCGPAGAVVVEVRSDLRMDELVCMTLSPVLAELFSTGRLRWDGAALLAEGIHLVENTRRWAGVFERLELLGLVSGSTLRRVHDAGYLRGLGSCWIGNEVIDEQGNVSVVDFDGGTERVAPYALEVAHRLRRLEVNRYCSLTHFVLAEDRPKALGMFGSALVDAVQRGYGEPFRPVPRDLLHDVIARHLAVWPVVRAGFGFPDDSGDGE